MWVYLAYAVLLFSGLCSSQDSGSSSVYKLINLLPIIRASAEVDGPTVNGIVTFFQLKIGGPVFVRGSISGLSPGQHGFHIHESGDLSGGCATTGGHFNPNKANHGVPNSPNSHKGGLPMITANSDGVAVINIIATRVALFGEDSIIGRAVVVHALFDDYGYGANQTESLKNGNSGARLGCGVIVAYNA